MHRTEGLLAIIVYNTSNQATITGSTVKTEETLPLDLTTPRNATWKNKSNERLQGTRQPQLRVRRANSPKMRPDPPRFVRVLREQALKITDSLKKESHFKKTKSLM